MTAGRIALVAGGLLLAALALLVILQAVHGAGGGGAGGQGAVGGAAAARSDPAAGAAAAGGRRAAETGNQPAPRWQSFERQDGPPPARPLVHLAHGFASPFDGPAAARGGLRQRPPQLHLQLEGVASGPRPTALISGRVVRAGSRIASFCVTRIAPRSVTLTAPGGARIELALTAATAAPERAGGAP